MKPSERIKEIINNAIKDGIVQMPDNKIELLSSSIYAILNYLDEEYEKEQDNKKYTGFI